jgi:adenosine deaminase
MYRASHIKTRSRMTVVALIIFLFSATSPAQPGAASEARTARRFELLRKSPPQLWEFLLRMPKGGDLHNHLSGAVYAESYIDWAGKAGLCINTKTMALLSGVCDPKSAQPPVVSVAPNSTIYEQMIDAWSMRNWQKSGESGHDHFFNTFIKFGPATWNNTGKMLAEVVKRAARGHVLFLEIMLTPDGTPTGIVSSQVGDKVGWNGNAEDTLNKLKSAGIDKAFTTAVQNLKDAEDAKNELLKCGNREADPGCFVQVRYVAQVSRGAQLQQVFAQMVAGFALADNPDSKVVGLNLVQPEDSPSSMKNFSEQMKMLQFLRPLYPHAHLSLHAGELAPGFVPDDGLKFHIRESVITARAERIGHGVDVMHEDQPIELLKDMAQRNVMVEICLSSNELILGISGAAHPLAKYLQFGVPVALATDDEGVSRSEISREFSKAVTDQGLGYLQLKMMARNSLQYAFVAGDSLWGDARRFVPVTQCRQDVAVMKLASSGCRQYVDNNEKAKLQWKLEEEFRKFEQRW